MHAAQEFKTVQPVTKEIEWKAKKKLEEYSHLFLLHPVPNLLLVTDNDVFFRFKSIESAVAYQIQQIEKVDDDAIGVESSHFKIGSSENIGVSS